MKLRFRSLVGSLVVTAALVPSIAQAQAGRDGMRTISATNVVLNRYTTLDAAAAPGASTITVASVAALASNEFASMSLSAGDLLLVYQPQGATIDGTDTAAYGTVTSLGNAGRWEFVRVGAVNAATNTVTLSATEHPMGLARAYSAGAQVVRVPQFSRLQVSASGSVVASPWNGATGGLVALVSSSDLTVVGSVSASGAGFRGGARDDDSNAPGSNTVLFRSATSADGAEKGEGIAGGAAAYDAMFNGRYGRGAPANGGGGGNAHNAGGGGGANGGAVAGYNGAGVMLAPNANFAQAWALDPQVMANGGMRTSGPGGGRGGYSFSSSGEDATVLAPGSATWGGDRRLEVGGRGGRSLGAALDRVYFGGGGGAGDGNNGIAGAGGAGGGLVFLVARAIDGNGVVSADGANGASVAGAGNDAPGGAGGGGSIVLSSVAPITSALIVRAQGGVGGSQSIAGNETEGPGGGGGGGVVWGGPMSTLSGAVTGGASGTTDSAAMTEFNVNGATNGGAGTFSATLAPCAMFTGICPLDTSTFVTVTSPMTGAFIATRTPTISGTAEPGATVAVTVNGMSFNVTANASGAWSVTLGAMAIAMDGAVTISVTATDASMNTANATTMVTVDTVAPSVAITMPSAMALLNTGAPTIRGTAEPNSTVTVSLGAGRTVMVTTDATGNWSYAVPAAMPLGDGPVTVSAVATDRAGNASAPSAVSFTVDTVTTVAITSPMSGATLGTRTPALRGTAEPNATVTVTVNGMTLMATADAMGQWSVVVPAGAIAMDGMVTFSVTSRDAAGNTATATSTVTVDSRVVVTITAPTNGATINSRNPTISGTARPNATVTLDFGGGRTAMVTADAMGNWRYTVPAGMELVDGAMVTVSATAMGADGPVTVSVTVTVDASTTVAVTSPMRESRVFERRPEVRGTAEPGVTITLVFDTGERATVTADAMGNWSFTPTMELSPGENSVRITAQDRAGNTATERHVFVVVVSTADAGVDASVDSGLPRDSGADSAMATDAASLDATASDAAVSDGATLPRGTLEGTGACGCTVVGNRTALGGRSALLMAAAAMVSATCARRNRRRSRR
jgi:hypothetical protein